jgi:hypothetical protein|tara:strand:+ start:10072 stop:10974 length:903 start_codon:yes stop_codon:yes gene_type:complete
MIEEKLTLLSLTYLDRSAINNMGVTQWHPVVETFKKSLKSFYDILDENNLGRPLHLIRDDSSMDNKMKVIESLEEVNANYKLIDGRKGAFFSVGELIRNVKTPYCMFILDDVEFITTKDILTPMIESLEKDEDIIQILFGGGFLTDSRESNNETINFTEDGTVTPYLNNQIYTRNKIDNNNTSWVTSLESDKIVDVFPLPYWNCLMQTKFFQKIDTKIESIFTESRPHSSWSDYCAYTNYSVNISPLISKEGWPEGFDFINQYKTSYLNFASYIYPHGRPGATFGENVEVFRKRCMNEII